MSIFRINKNSNYTVMSNCHLREVDMSLKSKGLLSIMLSLPDDWDYSIEGLVSICKENHTAIRSALSELKDFGYLEVVKYMPNETESGKIEYVYNVFEFPQDSFRKSPKQEHKKQILENQHTGFLYVENPRQLNTNNKILKTNNLNDNTLNNNLIDKLNNNNIYSIDSTPNKTITNTKSVKYIYSQVSKNSEKSEKTKSKKDQFAEDCKEIIDYLNQRTGSKYRTGIKATNDLIAARMKEGFTVEDFKQVIDNKVATWLNDRAMNKFLRPMTLFAAKKFESYLNEKKESDIGVSNRPDYYDYIKGEDSL